jgi:hypothetical protein
MTTNFKELIDLQRQLDEKLKTFSKEAFTEALAPFFAANPRVDSVTWTQYTPYFNDGDTCYFRVNEAYLVSESLAEEFPDSVEDYLEENALYVFSWRAENEPENDMTRASSALEEVWKEIPESVFETVFGDHVQVTIRRDGTVEVDEYNHD